MGVGVYELWQGRKGLAESRTLVGWGGGGLYWVVGVEGAGGDVGSSGCGREFRVAFANVVDFGGAFLGGHVWGCALANG